MVNDFPPSVPVSGGAVDPDEPPDEEAPDDPPDDDVPDDPPDDDAPDEPPEDELDEDELLVVVDVQATTVIIAQVPPRAKRVRESIGSE